jgi:hypothetical protein
VLDRREHLPFSDVATLEAAGLIWDEHTYVSSVHWLDNLQAPLQKT